MWRTLIGLREKRAISAAEKKLERARSPTNIPISIYVVIILSYEYIIKKYRPYESKQVCVNIFTLPPPL